MAKKLTYARVKAGRLISVFNDKRRKFSNAKKTYHALWIEDEDGGNERCLLFTDNELKRAEYRAKRNPEDCPDKSFLTDLLD